MTFTAAPTVLPAEPTQSQHMILDPTASYVTIINTYSAAANRAGVLLVALAEAALVVLRFVPGFVSASCHVCLDRTQVVNYAQWRDGDAIKAASADPHVAARIQDLGRIAESFTPVPYELRRSIPAVKVDLGKPS